MRCRQAHPWLLAVKTADDWQSKVDAWTATKTGPYSSQPYYLRLSKTGYPNAGTKYNLGNSSVTMDQRAVTDAGFLDLVRLGVYRANDPVIRNSLKVTDADIAFTTPNGQFWQVRSEPGHVFLPAGSTPLSFLRAGDSHFTPCSSLNESHRSSGSALPTNRPHSPAAA